MSAPQLEDGYMRIATELWQAICRLRIPGISRQVFDAIIRQTYGFNKKEDGIALSTFVELTGLPKYDVCAAIKQLEQMNLIVVAQKGNVPWKTYGVNKVYSTWRPLPKKAKANGTSHSLPNSPTTVAQKGNQPLPYSPTSINNVSIDNTSKDNTVVVSKDTDDETEKAIAKHLKSLGVSSPHAYLLKIKKLTGYNADAIKRAWREWKTGGINSKSQFYDRCLFHAGVPRPQ